MGATALAGITVHVFGDATASLVYPVKQAVHVVASAHVIQFETSQVTQAGVPRVASHLVPGGH